MDSSTTPRSSTSCARPTSRPPAPVVRTRPDDGAPFDAWGTWSVSRLQAALQSASRGQPRQQFALYAQMLQRWSRLAAVEATRRLAVSGLDWELVPGPGRRAASVARYCERTLAGLENLPLALAHLSTAGGYGLAVVELIWDGVALRDLQPVPPERLYSTHEEPWRLRIRTQTEGGPPVDTQPWKWLVQRSGPAGGGLFTGGLLRRSALLYLAQNISLKDWLIYSQVAGMPLRVARFDHVLSDLDKRRLIDMLNQLGTDAVAAVSKNVELDFIHAGQGRPPYADLQEYCNREVTILWLGQHLTTDIVGEGSRAAAEIHDRVREDLLVHDLAEESRAIERDLLRPLVSERFGASAPVPRFRRNLVQATDSRTLVTTLAAAVRDLGLAVPRRWAHQALGIPEATDGEETVTGREPA